MSFWKSLGNGLKKVAKVALPIAAGYFGGPLISSAMGALGGVFGGGGGDGGAQEPAVPPGQAPGPGGTGFGGFLSGLGNAFGSVGGAIGQAASSGIPWAGLISGGATYAGQQQTNAANAEMAQKQMDFQAAANQKQMDFQERMSNTQYQRATADMEKAGLNPMLGYSQGGAGNVGGSTSSGSTAVMANSVGQAVSSAVQAQQAAASIDQLNAGTAKAKADTLVSLAEADRVRSATNLSTAQRALTDEQAKNVALDVQYSGMTLDDRAAYQKWLKARTMEEAYKTGHEVVFQEKDYPRRDAERRFWEDDSMIGGRYAPYWSNAKQISGVGSDLTDMMMGPLKLGPKVINNYIRGGR